MRVLRNRGSVSGRDAYTKWHWGINPAHETTWDDPRRDRKNRDVLPATLIECGRLRELSFLQPDTHKTGTLRPDHPKLCYLTFDPDHPFGRLYVLLDPNEEATVRAKLWKENPYKPFTLEDLAKRVGGRHATADYPDLMVKPFGLLLDFMYSTEKKGDGYSHYVHRAGEESGIRPCLAADVCGRIWVAGGNYTSPTPGVTD